MISNNIENCETNQQQEQQSKDAEQNNSLPQLSSPDIHNQQFNNQLIHQEASSIKVSIDNQLKKRDECLNQEFNKQFNQIYEKEQIQKQQLEETIKVKDKQLLSQNLEIQQIKQTQIKIQQPIVKPFTYKLIEKCLIRQEEGCYAIAINKDCSIIIAGYGKQLNVFEFKQEQLKKTQLLSEHKNYVTTLHFMKKSNQFISGSYDKSIIIWSMNKSNQWICQQKLNGHNNTIQCLVLNNDEDLIISGGWDNSIKFWMKQNQWLCQQTITDHTGIVLGLSLNQQQNKVISCGEDGQILIIEQSQQNSQWIVIQKINVETYGSRICFINDNVFTFQPNKKEQMHVYEMNNTNKQYLKTKDILVNGGSDCYLFPQQHIQSKRLLINKNDMYVNLIRTNENGEFKTEQSIEYGDHSIYGCMSDDGQYLITWDAGSENIQILKYNEK